MNATTTVNRSSKNQTRQPQVSAEEAFERYFSILIDRIKLLLNPPTPSEQAFIFPTDLIDNNPILMSSMLNLLDMVGSRFKSPTIKAIMARKLLRWMLNERPDVIDSLLQ